MAFSINGTLKLDGGDFHATLAKAKSATSAFGTSLAGMAKNKLVGLIGIGALAAEAKQVIDYAGRINDLSTRLGVSAEALQKLDYAAQLTGGTLDDFVGVLQKLAVNRKKALDDPDGATARAFAKLGISVEMLKHARLEDLLLKIGDGFKDAADPQALMTEMIEVLGKSSGAVFAAMREGLGDLGDEAKRLGLVIEDDVIKKLDEVGDKWAALGKRAASGFAPMLVVIAEIGQRFVDLMSMIGEVFAGFPARIAGAMAGGLSFKEAFRDAFAETKRNIEATIEGFEQRNRPRPPRPAAPVLDVEGDPQKAKNAALREAEDVLKIRERIHELSLKEMTTTERRKAIEADIAELHRQRAFFAAIYTDDAKELAELDLKLAEKNAAMRALKADKIMPSDQLARIGGFRGGGNPYTNDVHDIRRQLDQIRQNTNKAADNTGRIDRALGGN